MRKRVGLCVRKRAQKEALSREEKGTKKRDKAVGLRRLKDASKRWLGREQEWL